MALQKLLLLSTTNSLVALIWLQRTFQSELPSLTPHSSTEHPSQHNRQGGIEVCGGGIVVSGQRWNIPPSKCSSIANSHSHTKIQADAKIITNYSLVCKILDWDMVYTNFWAVYTYKKSAGSATSSDGRTSSPLAFGAGKGKQRNKTAMSKWAGRSSFFFSFSLLAWINCKYL